MADLDYFRDLGYCETEIAGMAQCGYHRERLATVEAAVPVAAPETPATSIALPPTTVADTDIHSWVQLAVQRLLFGDSDQREALMESGQMGLGCFRSQNLVLSDSDRLTRDHVFQGLPLRSVLPCRRGVGKSGKCGYYWCGFFDRLQRRYFPKPCRREPPGL